MRGEGEKTMNFVDFFAGIGGIRLGLEQAGHKCVGFCEFDKYARTAYKAMCRSREGAWIEIALSANYNLGEGSLPRGSVD